MQYGAVSLWNARRVAAALWTGFGRNEVRLRLLHDACGAAGHDTLDAMRRAFPLP